MRMGTPPFNVVITDAHGVTITFTSDDFDLEPEIEERTVLTPPPYEVVMEYGPARIKYYSVRGTAPSIARWAPGCTQRVPGISAPNPKEEPVAQHPGIKVNVTPEVSPESLEILQKAVNEAVRIGVVNALHELADELEKDDDDG